SQPRREGVLPGRLTRRRLQPQLEHVLLNRLIGETFVVPPAHEHPTLSTTNQTPRLPHSWRRKSPADRGRRDCYCHTFSPFLGSMASAGLGAGVRGCAVAVKVSLACHCER
ncbi:unnamed protein product, partial [Ectocarpus sp. 4 AP-2014]